MMLKPAIVIAMLWGGPSHAYEEIFTFVEHGTPPTRPHDTLDVVVIKDEEPLGVLGGFGKWARAMNKGLIEPCCPTSSYPRGLKFSLKMTSVTVGQFLDVLMAIDGHHTWAHEDSVFVFALKGSTSGVAEKLNERVGLFEASDVTIYEAKAELVAQAQSQGITGIFADSREITTKYFSPPDRISKEPERFSLSLRDKTLRECLNAIVAADPPSEWIASRYWGKAWKEERGKIWISVMRRHDHTYMKDGVPVQKNRIVPVPEQRPNGWTEPRHE